MDRTRLGKARMRDGRAIPAKHKAEGLAFMTFQTADLNRRDTRTTCSDRIQYYPIDQEVYCAIDWKARSSTFAIQSPPFLRDGSTSIHSAVHPVRRLWSPRRCLLRHNQERGRLAPCGHYGWPFRAQHHFRSTRSNKDSILRSAT